ncbi:MAG: MATE family efflux transporter [Lachnospiraceae bacterium]|nr:MATE family efflux transporter [Lachnospiraceae bacterium]MCI8996895.1 MATE family efflux transporter [Lachnospiraceae bacterium]MCI9135492.1 MATE family efflux transporter [Lachnospiraceae bacterium]
MKEEIQQENKMGTMPVNKLLIRMALPMIASMLVQALYNIVDSAFVARVNDNALTAVSMAFPVQNLMIAVGVGTGVGVNALLSRSLGAKDQEAVNLAAKNGLFLAAASYVLFALFGIFGSRLFFEAQIADTQVITYGVQYTRTVTLLSFGAFLVIMSERLLQSTGLTIYTMVTQLTGAIINVILDPIMIFGLFGFPRLEVLGAALATVIGQIIGMLLAIYLNIKKNREININMRHFRPHLPTIRVIYSVGLPSIIMQSISSVMVFGMNKICMQYLSALAVNVFGIYFKLQSFIFMPVFGLNNGMVPIIAYNYGARNKKRILDTIRLSVMIAVGIMLAGLLIFQVLTPQLLGIFEASEETLKIGVPALRIISLSFVFAGYCIILGSVFQALGNGVYSLINSIARQMLVILPVAYVFARFWRPEALWWSFPIAEIVSVILSTVMLMWIYRDKIAPLGDKNS